MRVLVYPPLTKTVYNALFQHLVLSNYPISSKIKNPNIPFNNRAHTNSSHPYIYIYHTRETHRQQPAAGDLRNNARMVISISCSREKRGALLFICIMRVAALWSEKRNNCSIHTTRARLFSQLWIITTRISIARMGIVVYADWPYHSVLLIISFAVPILF